MCKNCGKLKEGKVHLIDVGSGLIEFARERNIEEVVKYNGRMLIATINTDYDSDGKFIGDYSKDYASAEKYVLKYNPDGLSHKDYRKAQSKEKLPWQNQGYEK